MEVPSPEGTQRLENGKDETGLETCEVAEPVGIWD